MILQIKCHLTSNLPLLHKSIMDSTVSPKTPPTCVWYSTYHRLSEQGFSVLTCCIYRRISFKYDHFFFKYSHKTLHTCPMKVRRRNWVYRKISNIRHQISNLKCFSSRPAVVFGLYIKARCLAENEDVVGAAPTGDAPTTSEWSTI